MTMPFSRPGAIDLSALKAPARPAGGPAGAGAPGASGGGGGPSWTLEVDDQSFQGLLESSMDAPVVLVVYSPSRMPASVQLADDISAIADGLEGRVAVGRVDIDAQPSIGQALQVPSVPLVALVLQGRLQPLFQEVPALDELRAFFGQLLQQMTSQGITGRHQPFAVGPGAEEPEAEDAVDPRYAPAEDALMAGDLDTAIAEYQKLLDASPGDAEAAVGLSRARLMKRTADADPATARQAAADRPDDVEAQLLVADIDLLGGHVKDAFARLLDLVRRTSGDERTAARVHLLELFAVVGNDDPRVLAGRRDLASALF